MVPKFLRPEVFPIREIEIVRARFHTFITDPATGPTLDAMLEDNAATDAAIAARDAAIEAEREERAYLDASDERAGETCGRACGYCGRCS